MKKFMKIASIFAVAIMALSAFLPAMGTSTESENNKMISITTSIFYGHGEKNIVIDVTKAKAEIIMHRLEQMNNALERGDKNGIMAGISFLDREGMLDGNDGKAYSLLSGSGISLFNSPAVYENISNTLCYVNAVGRGLMIFTVGYILAALAGNGIVLSPIIYLTIMVLTHLVPLRILLPVGVLAMDEGTISTLGLNGFQTQKTSNETIAINLVGFTGIVINIPFSNSDSGPFLFLSGFSLMAKNGGLPVSQIS